MSIQFLAFAEAFPLAREFRISRGAKTQADVVTVIVTDGHYYGWASLSLMPVTTRVLAVCWHSSIALKIAWQR